MMNNAATLLKGARWRPTTRGTMVLGGADLQAALRDLPEDCFTVPAAPRKATTSATTKRAAPTAQKPWDLNRATAPISAPEPHRPVVTPTSTIDQRRWDGDAELRRSFRDNRGSFLAYQRAVRRGQAPELPRAAPRQAVRSTPRPPVQRDPREAKHSTEALAEQRWQEDEQLRASFGGERGRGAYLALERAKRRGVHGGPHPR